MIDLTCDAIKKSPPYEPSRPITREYESELHAHYGREGYWPRG